ncbi:phosphoenolpyruvate-protein phosphotransferase [endosymbiont of Euscepes postfasciatus]|uniref:putative PEP-binding protein n=1 Tax=endosymbiont of Euscepes postfasciatus TaxID=650377 RepID=UPI000DC72B8F|nr:putative PEP-binding protein [endosymbiont of Euscepes postfasciatus]BBA84623.1 phosphoenolpyruvate-protein phosphotransferase [endosymbiont of Euscepes postfasciatus]
MILNNGIIVSKGLSKGSAFIIKKENFIEEKKISKKEIDIELNKFLLSYKLTINELENIEKRAKIVFNNDNNEIFKAEILILKNKNIINEIKDSICKKLYSSEYSIYYVIKKKINNIFNKDNIYKSDYIIDICNRLINNINKKTLLSINNNNIILISKNILPSYILEINKNILGIISENGNYISHSCIIARSLRIPMIVGIKNIYNIIKNNDYIILDAINNKLFINPNSLEIYKFNLKYKKKIKKENKNKFIKKNIFLNKNIKFYININSSYDIEKLYKYNIYDIGLCRSEFLFNNKNIYEENFQFNQYKKILNILKNNTLTIRIFDILRNNFLCNKNNIYKEEEIFFKNKKINYFNLKNILTIQIQAILRASYFGNIRILLPMISIYEEVIEIKKIIKKVKLYFIKNKILFDKNIKIGIMIETPSIIMILNKIIKYIDFFVIGLNDLTRHTLAFDRSNANFFSYKSIYPSIIIFIKKIIDIVGLKKELYLCGEILDNKNYIKLLISLGIKKFSINIVDINRFNKIINDIDIKKIKKNNYLILNQYKINNIIKILNKC